MNRRLWCSALLLGALLGAHGEMTQLSLPLTQQGFERIGEQRGVTVYRHKDKRIIRLAAEGRIAASPQQVQRALLGYEQQTNKINRLSESRILSGGPGYLVVHQRISLPVVSDRDFNLLVTWGGDREKLWVHYRALPNQGLPPRDGVVRVSKHDGSWQLKPINGGRETWVRFEIAIDLGGWLPLWLVRPEATKEVPQVFAAIRRMCG